MVGGFREWDEITQPKGIPRENRISDEGYDLPSPSYFLKRLLEYDKRTKIVRNLLG